MSVSITIAPGGTFAADAGNTLTHQLILSGTGTYTIDGVGPSSGVTAEDSGGISAGQTLVLDDASYTVEGTSSQLSGVVVLDGGTMATGQVVTNGLTVDFDKVSLGGTNNLYDAYVNNAGISYENFGYGDAIEFNGESGFTLAVVLDTGNSYFLEDVKGGSARTLGIVTLAAGTTIADFTHSATEFSYDGPPPCFCAGTRLATPDGAIAVEDIIAGTMLLTAAGEAKPVRWLGHSAVSATFADALTRMPVRIKVGALGENLPVSDLLVSPCHAMFMDGVLVQAGALVNGSSIVRERNMPETFIYYHVELAEHELLLAEGAPTESFVDNVDRMGFTNWAEHEALGDIAPIKEMPYPRVKSNRQIPSRLRRKIAAHAVPFERLLVA